jgi:hypothetical protein
MRSPVLLRRSERALLHDAAAHHAQELEGRNKLVADIAEIDARKVYRRAGYDSIHSYCVHEFDLTVKAAFHRIHVARVAWRFPAVLAALAEGRLHVTAVRMLAPRLRMENAAELVEAAAHRSKAQIEQLLAERFPRPKLPLLLEVLAVSEQLPVAGVAPPSVPMEAPPESQRPPGGVEAAVAVSVPAPVTTPVTLVPLLPPRFPLKVSLRQETHEKLRHARELLGHQLPSGDVAEVLDRALDALIAKLEKRKFAATDRPRPSQLAATPGSRHISAEVQRAVWVRDGAQCTFVGENGKRCPARKMLEFDHILEVARGGGSTESNVRLLCKAHNQYRAEQTYGSGFMERRRQEARVARAEAAAKESAEQVSGCMRRLGFTADEARRAGTHAASLPDASLEERVRAALSYLVPPKRQVGGHSALKRPEVDASTGWG